MIRINYIRQATHLIVFLIIQLPLLYRLILFDVAFGFFYVGYVLFLPISLNKSLAMVIAFASGLLVDVFSNTPGIHAAACVFIAFVRDMWYQITIGSPEDEVNISWTDLKSWGSVKFLLPLVFVHHLIIFTIENEGLGAFWLLINKVIFSSLYSFAIIFCLSLLISPRERRR